MDRKRLLRNPLLWILVVVLLYFGISMLFDDPRGYTEVPTSKAVSQISSGNVEKAELEDKEQRLKLTLRNPIEQDGQQVKQILTQYPGGGQVTNELYSALLKNSNTEFNTTVTQESFLTQILIFIIPLGLLLILLMWMMNNVQGGGNRVLNFGKSRAKQLPKDMPKTTFADVAGVDEAVEELHEIKDFLQNPARYQALGAKIPKGVLLYGPPGTGKTLLARAVAGEAGVPFYTISGSDFVEMFVGVGASRVRDLFEQAKQNAPCIIFVDEIDAVGRQRGAGLGGGHDEREQTLNQLLVEMDGFDLRQGVILIAATNRPDILDPALLRPGRFDRQIVVDRPDLEGRRAILNVHSKGKPIADDADLEVLARRTPGFTGADLANLMNEATLLAARKGRDMVSNLDLDEAVDRVVAGPERKSRIISEKEKLVIAYHEGGHALVSHALPNADPVHKVSIIPRGRALGYTLTLPLEDKYLVTRSELSDELAMLLGGRTAEELIFTDPTTGAQNDIERATKIARSMVTESGMSDALGPMQFGQHHAEVFLGRDFAAQPDYSDEVAAKIDGEVRRLIDAAHATALDILTTYRTVLDQMAEALIEKETLETEEVMAILDPVPKWTDPETNGGRLPPPPPATQPAASPASLATPKPETP